MSSREFSEWIAFYSLEPFGEDREDLRSGIVASVVANTVRDPESQPEPFQPADFMPRFGAEDEEETAPEDPARLYRRFRTWAILAGARLPGDDRWRAWRSWQD